MLVTLKFYYKDPTLPSYPVGRDEPRSGQVIPVQVDVAEIPVAGGNNCISYAGREMPVIRVITAVNPQPEDSVADILLDNSKR